MFEGWFIFFSVFLVFLAGFTSGRRAHCVCADLHILIM